jgi:hypothetical protein
MACADCDLSEHCRCVRLREQKTTEAQAPDRASCAACNASAPDAARSGSVRRSSNVALVLAAVTGTQRQIRLT